MKDILKELCQIHSLQSIEIDEMTMSEKPQVKIFFSGTSLTFDERGLAYRLLSEQKDFDWAIEVRD